MKERQNTISFALPGGREERISKHFVLKDFTRSGTAIRYGLDNEPDDLAYQNLKLLCENVLEPLWCRFGVIRIVSGYRSVKVNEAVGGKEFSQHRFGQAVDVFVLNAEIGKKMFEFIRGNTDFDQLVYIYREKTGRHMLHISYNIEHNRQEAKMDYRMFS